MKPAQGQLIDTGAARCLRCRGALGSGNRCRVCDKGEIPAPGSPRHRTWTRGLCRTILDRLCAAGLGRLATDAARAFLVEDVAMPPEAAPLIADITAMPASAAKYRRVVDRAFIQSCAYARFRRAGWESEEANRAAFEVADETLAAREARAKIRIDVPAPRVRIAVDDVRAEEEAAEALVLAEARIVRRVA